MWLSPVGVGLIRETNAHVPQKYGTLALLWATPDTAKPPERSAGKNRLPGTQRFTSLKTQKEHATSSSVLSCQDINNMWVFAFWLKGSFKGASS